MRTACLRSAEEITPVIPIASGGKRAEPLVRMGLKGGCTGTDHLATLAPEISWSADLVEATLRLRPVGSLWHRSLSCRLPGPIDIKHDPGRTLSIQQTSRYLPSLGA